eukprot:scaffold1659_cov371-Prasinococcus_capsulatus_cf.AAC.21
MADVLYARNLLPSQVEGVEFLVALADFAHEVLCESRHRGLIQRAVSSLPRAHFLPRTAPSPPRQPGLLYIRALCYVVVSFLCCHLATPPDVCAAPAVQRHSSQPLPAKESHRAGADARQFLQPSPSNGVRRDP